MNQNQVNSFKTLRFKLSLVFGSFSVFCVIIASYIAFDKAVSEFNREINVNLKAVGSLLSQIVDPEKLDKLRSFKDPYYKELKTLLRNITKNFNMSWLAMYRHNGKFFTHIVDGAEMGGEFCLDYPILDTTDEMVEAFTKGNPLVTDNYVDSYGTWKSFFIPIKQADGKVIAIIDSSKNVELLNRLKGETFNKAVNVVVLVIALSLIVCFLFSHSLSKPLMQLTDGANLIASGNLRTRISGIGSNDEIGVLVNTFNTMAEQLSRSKDALERKIFELTVLYEISQKINFANNTQEILRLILEKSIEALKADRGSIMLFSEESEILNVEVVFGKGIGRIEKRIEIHPGEGVAGKVFEESKHIIINENIETIFKPYEVNVDSEVRNIMCLPLVLEKKPIGVINIVNKISGPFDDNDLELGSTMASQIALTIEKSRLYELSITDGLTKLFVHRYFQIALESELKRSKRYNKHLSIILFDIDHFKKFNDTYGHQIGDKVLSCTAAIVKDAIRNIDVAARYGGEEFVVILPETETRPAYEVAERLRKRIEAYDYPGNDGKMLKVTISLGVSSFPTHAADRLDLIKRADEALYVCKRKGRNCTTIFSADMNEGVKPESKA